MVGQAVPRPNPLMTPQGLEARKQALIQRLSGGSMPPYHPFNQQTNIPGNTDLTPPIQMLYTGYAAGSGQAGSPAAQMSGVNPNIQALSNVRGAY